MSDTSSHIEGFVWIPDGPLHYLDWGGSGPTLILIHGLGDNPHAFDDLAPALITHFRVLAYARRGHGRSFKRGRLILQRWCVTFKAYPYNESRPADALKSLDAFRQWQRRTYFSGISDPSRIEGYIRGLVDIQPDGSVKPLMSESLANQVNDALLANQRDYLRVKAPVLAIYASTFVDTRFGDAERQAKTRLWEDSYMRPFRDKSISRIQQEIPHAKVMFVTGTHADFFFNSRDEVASAIISFLTSP